MMKKNDPVLAVILGSGLSIIADMFVGKRTVSAEFSGDKELSTYVCDANGVSLLIFSGRKHYYEGYSPAELISSVRTAGEMGAKYLLLTNAAGGLSENFSVSDLMLIESHLNLNPNFIFNRPSGTYSEEFKTKLKTASIKNGIKLKSGVFGCVTGPAYETKAEIRMLKKIGIDAVGMSTVPEAFEAARLGIKTAGISVISNLLRENNPVPANHEEIIISASKASDELFSLINRVIIELN